MISIYYSHQSNYSTLSKRIHKYLRTDKPSQTFTNLHKPSQTFTNLSKNRKLYAKNHWNLIFAVKFAGRDCDRATNQTPNCETAIPDSFDV
ncbi:hypothetical protein K0M31_003546 [Melipona bicolor]|uniref:Uncharacterized protein n=1 Tax=Melipona bicolor TaxID=60889 RepID=A0AA40FZ86_9HYME|nr:hypothetical protein K0M31_003546 [Melipona bicolor]